MNDAGTNPRATRYSTNDTALLFVDVQKMFCLPGRDPGHPEMGADHYYYRRLAETAIPNQSRLIRSARSKGIPVLHTIIEALTTDCRDISLDHRLSGLMVPKGHPDAQPIDELTPAENEVVLPKSSSGVFNSTVIDYVLRNMGVSRLIIAGVVTDQCVDMAVRDAADKGYLVSLPEDACATYTPERHVGALKAFGGYCWVTDTDTVVGLIDRAGRAT